MPDPCGEVFQLGYVFRDMDGALDHWIGTLGVGPFFKMRVESETEIYGTHMMLRCDIALSYWNDFQIELISPLDDAPTHYGRFLGSGPGGLQHLGTLTPDFARDEHRLMSSGNERLLRAEFNGSQIGYYGTDRNFPGTMIELVEKTDFFLGFNQAIRSASETWDGREPVRPIESLFAS
jgi:hypothetical protein